jgi:hypothetical protein
MMPLDHAMRAGKSLEKMILGRALRDCDGVDPYFAGPGLADTAAECIRQQLVPQADAHVRLRPVYHPFSYRFLFCDEPGILVRLPDILRPSQDEQEIEISKLRDFLPLPQANRVGSITILGKEIGEPANCIVIHMLENKNALHGKLLFYSDLDLSLVI